VLLTLLTDTQSTRAKTPAADPATRTTVTLDAGVSSVAGGRVTHGGLPDVPHPQLHDRVEHLYVHDPRLIAMQEPERTWDHVGERVSALLVQKFGRGPC
jgi:hypothetical protein